MHRNRERPKVLSITRRLTRLATSSLSYSYYSDMLLTKSAQSARKPLFAKWFEESSSANPRQIRAKPGDRITTS